MRCRSVLGMAGLHRLRKQSVTTASPWKSGPLGPRKAALDQMGFSPLEAKQIHWDLNNRG